ncbi:MAG: hypothetical protein QGH15_20030 [Kiritimatiellia bacterium]|nr:hypothetical protein [Kiritimatiellia bacterium]
MKTSILLLVVLGLAYTNWVRAQIAGGNRLSDVTSVPDLAFE